MTRSTRFLLAPLVVLGLGALPAVAQTIGYPEDPDRLVVVDSLGQTVGPVVSLDGASGNVVVLLTVDDRIFRVGVKPQGFLYRGDLHYVASNCTGMPYMHVSQVDRVIVDWAVIQPPGATLYLPEPLNTQTTILPRSVGPTSCTVLSSGQSPGSYVEARAAVDLSQHFTPPFNVTQRCPSACASLRRVSADSGTPRIP